MAGGKIHSVHTPGYTLPLLHPSSNALIRSGWMSRLYQRWRDATWPGSGHLSGHLPPLSRAWAPALWAPSPPWYCPRLQNFLSPVPGMFFGWLQDLTTKCRPLFKCHIIIGLFFFFSFFKKWKHSWFMWVSLLAQLVKNPPAIQETPVQSLGLEDPFEKG